MQELKLILTESDTASLVLHSTQDESEFFLPITEELRSLLTETTTHPPSPGSTDTEDDKTAAQATNTHISTAELSGSPSTPRQSDNQQQSPSQSHSSANLQEHSAQGSVLTEPAAQETNTDGGKKRRFRSHINMSPRTIQDRIRHGASVQQLAQEVDTDEARIEPYAWPIIQERARIADLAHAAHPVSAEGPAKNSLWEVLATALAARGATLNEASWEAHQDPSHRWLVTISWIKEAAGQTSTHQAQFFFEHSSPGPDLAHPVDSVAHDLIDPRFGQPVRRIAAVTPLPGHTTEATHAQESTANADYSEYDTYDDNGDPLPGHPSRNAQKPEQTALPTGQHPAHNNPKPQRRRKAVTPHWEDVLLGVRTNPRKKK